MLTANLATLLEAYPWLKIQFLNNNIEAWIIALIIFILTFVFLKIFKNYLIIKLKIITDKTINKLDDICIKALDDIHWPFYVFIAFYVSVKFLQLAPRFKESLDYLFIILTTFYAVRFIQSYINFIAEKFINQRKEENNNNIAIIEVISGVIKVGLWIGGILLILANLGYNINSLITGLGIGGIAIALALQNILSDIFSSLSIFFDKPFQVGDFIALGEHKGTVQKIGIKTTRLKSLQGEELVISNNELTKSRLQNYGVMDERRVAFTLNINQDTPILKLKKIPGIIAQIIETREKTRLERVHFTEIHQDHFIYSIVYYVLSKEYISYVEIQQAINLAIIEKLRKEKIKLSHPAQTIYFKKN